MRFIIELLAALFWLAGLILLGIGFIGGNALQTGYNLQLSVSCFLCGIFLLLYNQRNSE